MKKTNKIILTALFPLISFSSCDNLFPTQNSTSSTDSNDNNSGFEDFDIPNNENNDNITPKKDSDNKPQDSSKEEVVEEKDYVPKKKEAAVIEEYNPIIQSNKYHAGFEKRIRSSLFPHEPKVRQELPVMNITTPDGKNNFATMPLDSMYQIYQAKKDNEIVYTPCSVKVSNCEEEFCFENIEAQVKVRGNASCYADKRSLSLKFNEKRSLLGINNNKKFKKYVLDSLYYDPSFQKESTALYLGKQMFNYDGIFTSDTMPVVLYLNNKYWGVYLLKESIQVNKNRINIDDIEKREPAGAYTGIDTGYIFEYDGYAILEEKYGLDPIFRIDYNNNAPLKTIDGKTTYQAAETYMSEDMLDEFTLKTDIYSQDQLDFLSSYVGNVYKIVYEAAYNDKYYVFNSDYSNIVERPDLTCRQVINKVIDIDSFVNMYLLQEMCCNNDMYWSSQFFQLDMSKSGNKKLTFTSAWDYDWGFGRGAIMNSTNKSGTDVNTLYAAIQYERMYTNAWYLLLIHEDWYIDLVKEKWKLLVDNGVLYNALHYIDELSFVYTNYYEANFEKWPFAIFYNEPQIYQDNYDNLPKQSDYLFKWLGGKFNYLNTVYGDGSKLFNF